MKHFLFLCIFFFTSLSIFADAGFSIRREHAVSIFSFEGINNLKGYKLIQTHVGFYTDTSHKEPYTNLGRIITDDNYTITTQEGGRHWEESDRDIYLNVVDMLTGKTTDSLKYFAKDYNIHFKIKAVVNGKLQFTADSSKAVYQYSLLNPEESKATYSRNRLIFIACSALGFLFLIGLFIRNKNKTSK